MVRIKPATPIIPGASMARSPSREARPATAPAPASSPQSKVIPNGSRSPRTWHVFLAVFAYRTVNALTLRTMYVPDEYYQALEPAWQLAFGPSAGAWITWEWRHQLRSSLHPVLFAGVYRAASTLSSLVDANAGLNAEILIAAPKIAQACFAAGLDFYTWRLAQKIFGSGGRVGWVVLAVSLLSPWMWFTSTRTLSNSIEGTLTAAALFYWPWHWSLPSRGSTPRKSKARVGGQPSLDDSEQTSSLRSSLLLAATASILRPTNVLFWIPVALQTFLGVEGSQRIKLITEAIGCGSLIAGLSAALDSWYYGFPVFPPLKFLTYNIYQDLAVFYGRNRPDYYFTEGLPLLLLGLIPFALFAIYRSLAMLGSARLSASQSLEPTVLPAFTLSTIFVTFGLSLISHKEARFIYPLLPGLHILSGTAVAVWIRRVSIWRVWTMLIILVLHLLLANFVSRTHQKGVIDVLHYLRREHMARADPSINTTVAFLMPCHSTAWRSHLVDPKIDAWALTCEPPVDMSPEQRTAYMDEADVFYEDPFTWMLTYMEGLHAAKASNIAAQSRKAADHSLRTFNGQITGRERPWPQHVVFFQQLEPQMEDWFKYTPYKECWRTFNTNWHDDWRRKGDIVVYCLPS